MGENRPKWYPTNNDVKDLSEKLSAYKQERVNGKLQSRFDLYCKTVGVIGFDEFGGIIVYQPEDYKRLSDIYWKLKGKEDADTEFRMRNNPEERLALVERIKSMGVKFRLV